MKLILRYTKLEEWIYQNLGSQCYTDDKIAKERGYVQYKNYFTLRRNIEFRFK